MRASSLNFESSSSRLSSDESEDALKIDDARVLGEPKLEKLDTEPGRVYGTLYTIRSSGSSSSDRKSVVSSTEDRFIISAAIVRFLWLNRSRWDGVISTASCELLSAVPGPRTARFRGKERAVLDRDTDPSNGTSSKDSWITSRSDGRNMEAARGEIRGIIRCRDFFTSFRKRKLLNITGRCSRSVSQRRV
ncbi:hypothetical protein KL940_005330 [Ogataea angusta]|uniref:Uncharacterized protein n=1 Tax=Pichia angusta TaxID=870730 RepID=A0ABQ7RPD4_PICAN|nr:hypothetical protein KL940_005330 [Ogataea angusta]